MLAVGIAVAGLGLGLGLQTHAQTPDEGPAQVSDQTSNAAVAQSAGTAATDPPTRVVRISILQGDVSAEPASVNVFSPAELNQVLTSGDRVYTDQEAEAELQSGQLAVRLGGGTDLTVTAMTDQLAQFGLAAGSAHIRTYAIPAGTVLEVDTGEAAITVLQPGDVRIDEDAAGHTTTVTVLTGQAQVDGPQVSQQLNAGDRLRIHGADPATGGQASAEPLPPGGEDSLDGFSGGRDNLYANGAQASQDLLNPETTGGADLSSYGSWDSVSDVGPVWYPAVAVGWQPYCYGHWRWVSPWGWTWVGSEPWAFAPSHYGRWINVDGRWGWLPGPSRLRPVYAPALVAFVGAGRPSAALGSGPGSSVTAWFPLGPHEPYLPWYHGSTLYLNRVNASNMPNLNAAEARAFYNQRAVNVFAGAPDAATNRPYANRSVGTVAMPQESFAAGRSVARNQIRLSASQLAEAPVLAHPAVNPERSMVVPGPPRAVPAHLDRPVEPAQSAVRSGSEGTDSPELANRPAFFYRQTPPPVVRPSFEQQRQAMERTEPGRPVTPQASVAPRPAGPRPAAPAAPKAEPAKPAPAPSTPHR